MSDAGSLAVAADLSNSGVTSFAQQAFAPGYTPAPQSYSGYAPATAIRPEGFAPGLFAFSCLHFISPKHVSDQLLSCL